MAQIKVQICVVLLAGLVPETAAFIKTRVVGNPPAPQTTTSTSYATSRWAQLCASCDEGIGSSPHQSSAKRYLSGRLASAARSLDQTGLGSTDGLKAAASAAFSVQAVKSTAKVAGRSASASPFKVVALAASAAYASGRWLDVCESSDACSSSPQQASRSQYMKSRAKISALAVRGGALVALGSPLRRPSAVIMRAKGGGGADIGSSAPRRMVMGLPLPTLLLGLLVAHKCVTDTLSQYTRTTGTPYSATTVAILGELIKAPILLGAIAVFEGPKRVGPILREAWSDSPGSMCLPGLAYSAQNVLYFMALTHISAASYQILSQTKLIFTGVFMRVLGVSKLGPSQYAALALLMFGSTLTQLAEVSRAALVGSGGLATAALYGGALTVAGAALSALPNVYYEKVLKSEGQNQWAKNVQLTCWIAAWLVLSSVPATIRSLATGVNGAAGGNFLGAISPASVAASVTGAMTGVTPLVWAVTLLQGLKCLIIPATLKYADNIAYAYAKPASILATALAGAAVTGSLPSAQFAAGAACVFVSMWMYGL